MPVANLVLFYMPSFYLEGRFAPKNRTQLLSKGSALQKLEGDAPRVSLFSLCAA
jgi:hypothetical protein